MKKKKVMSVVLAAIMTVGLLSGCGTSKESDSKEGEQVTLNYWTWFPSTDQIEQTVKAFEKENPDIKINMTVMESKAFQEKVPLALSTEEDIDVIGVQPSAFAEEVQDYLANLDELMPEAAGEDWKELYSEKCLEQGNHLTSGDTKMLVLTNSGSMIGYYNAALLKELGCDVPKTIEEYKVAAEKLKEIIYVFLTIFLYLLKCPQSLILSALRAFCLCGKPHISRLIFLYFPCQSWLKSW